MRLHNLTLENINSLKGKHSISFLEMARESDLFAITGPTGSGKSTILISIMMALYGEHPKRLNAKDIVTMGEAYGKIDCTFEHLRKIYHISWECQVLKKNGEPRKNPSITRVIKRGKEPIEENIADIIGLSFSQFTKVVILNQGQFAEFLTSSFKDRKNLLENLLDNKNLKDLAITLRKKLKELEVEKSHQKDILEATNLIDEEEEKRLTQNLKKLQKEKTELSENNEDLLKLIKTLEDIEKTLEKKEQIAKRKEEKEKEKASLYKSLSLLNETHKTKQSLLQESKKELKEKGPYFKAAKENKDRLQSINEKRDDLKKQNDQINEQVKELTKKIDDGLITQKSLQEEENTLQKALSGITRDNLEKQRTGLEKLKQNDQNLPHKNNERERITNSLESIEEQAKVKKTTIEALTKEFPQLLTEENFLETLELELSQLKEKEEAQRKVEFTREQAEKEHSSTLLEIKQKKQSYLEKTKSIEILTLTEASLEKDIESFKEKIKKIEFLRTGLDLKEDDCPFCQAPIAEEKLSHIKDHIEEGKSLTQDFDELCEKLKTKVGEKNQIEAQLNVLKESLHQLEVKRQEIAKRLSELKESPIVDYKRLINDSESLKYKYQEKSLLYQENQKSLTELRGQWSLENQQKEKVTKEIKEISENSLKIKETLPYKDLSLEDCQELFQTFQSLSLNQEKLSSISKEIDFYQKEKAIKKEQILDLGKKIDHLNHEEELALKEKEEEDYPKEPEKEYELLQASLEKHEREFQVVDKDKRDKDVEFSKVESNIGLLKEQNEDNERLLNFYLQNLLQCLEKDSFAKLDEETQTFLKLRSFALEKESSTSSLSLSQVRKEKFSPQQEKIEALLEEKKREIIILETKLKDNEEKKEKAKNLTDQLRKLEEQFIRFSELSPYIDKDKFRDFALEILENHLLQIANKEILSLADGRYQLQHAQAGQKSELLVVDLWQNGSLRKVSTLSGGETFLLSLGLALGLSEITRGQTEIGSFFIDEGFGTLDGESISLVLDCLLKMESKGKQIGIISHVKDLTQQIPLRLNLVKNNFGEAQIQYF